MANSRQGCSPRTGSSSSYTKELQSFLGLANYYRCFVSDFTTLATPLTDLLKGGGKGTKPVHLSTLALEAFQRLKKALCDQTQLHTFLPNLAFTMHTDASNTGLGVVLSQESPQGERPIYYLSRKLTPTEWKYTVIEKEAMAIRWAIEQHMYYLWGQEFTIITDHAPLQWLSRMKDTTPRLMKWYLVPYRFTIKCKGSDHANTDLFPRQTIWATLERQAYLCVGYVSPDPPRHQHPHHRNGINNPHGQNGGRKLRLKPRGVSDTPSHGPVAVREKPRHGHLKPVRQPLPMVKYWPSLPFGSGEC